MNLKYIIYFSLLLFTASCLPNLEKEDLQLVEKTIGNIDQSMYDYQMFYNLEQNQMVSLNKNEDWDLGFKSSGNQFYIILNYANSLAAINLGAIDFESAVSTPDNANWIYDASSGNLDSLAIMNWVDTSSAPFLYTNNVYLIGQKNDLDYTAKKKIQIIEITENSYTLKIASPEETSSQILTIDKNANTNFITYKIIDEIAEVSIYPDINNWDLLFTSYATILYTDDGIATPYLVRGVLINPEKVQVADYYIDENLVADDNYEESNLNTFFYISDNIDTNLLEYKSGNDAIGYSWKDVEILGGTSANYITNKRKIYFIKDKNGTLTKLRFLSFYNAGGQKGFPTFEYYSIAN